MRSKILSVILSICMVLTLTPAMAFAADTGNDVSPQAEAVTGSAIAMQTPGTTGYTVTEAKAVDGNLDVKITLDADFAEKAVKFTVKTTTAGITKAEGSADFSVSTEDPATVTSPAITVSCDGVTSEVPKTVTGTLTFTGAPNSETYNVTVTITKKSTGGEVPGPGEPTDPELPPVVNTTGGSIGMSDTIPEELADSITDALESGGGITVADSPELSNEIAKASAEAVEKVEISAEDISEIDGFFS